MTNVTRLRTQYKAPPKPFRDPLLDDVLSVLEPYGEAYIAQKSGLAESTIRNWRAGRTRCPQAVSYHIVLKVFGFKLKVEK